ncbi:MAG: hypothetical protein KGQ26_10630, partial [Rhodospirillales bacterium]|nr:hypothetical protein [Rhodospirillales bacterium]
GPSPSMEQGRLLAKGDPWEMRACPMRLSPGDSRRSAAIEGIVVGSPKTPTGRWMTTGPFSLVFQGISWRARRDSNS